jgi:hypothetical protein
LYSYLTQTKISFFKNGEQEDKTSPAWVLASVGWGGCRERVWEGEYGDNTVYTCMKMEQ